MDSALELSFLEVAHSSSSAENLRLDDLVSIEGLSGLQGIFLGESDFSEGDGDVVLVEELASLVLVQFDSSLGNGLSEQGSVSEHVFADDVL